jgi:hypothetical protein
MTLPVGILSGLLRSLQEAFTLAQANREWVVVVFPEGSGYHTAFTQGGAGMFPEGSTFLGRTVVLPKGGRVSVTVASAEVFIPQGIKFSLMFVGWGDDVSTEHRKMAAWRQQATRVIH